MNESQIGFAIGAIEGLKRERDQLLAWQRNALAVTKRQAEKIKALEQEVERLNTENTTINEHGLPPTPHDLSDSK